MLQLRAGEAEVDVDPEGGGRITRISAGGTELLTPAGLFVMAPWAGRTAYGRFAHAGRQHRLPIDQPPHAIHGTVRGVAWTVELAGDTTARLAAPLGPSWPWPGRCTHTVALRRDHLDLTLSVEAEGEPFPAAAGWHPWFVKPESVALTADALLERGDDHLPTGRRMAPVAPGDRPLDDGFEGVRWPVLLTFADGTALRIDATGCPYAVVFDELAGTTCVEPQTAPPNALNTGEATSVAPGRPLRATMRISWR